MTHPASRPTYVTNDQFEEARAFISRHTHPTPLITSGQLSAATGFDVHLKAEMFQKTGSYKIRGALNKIRKLTDEQRARGVICSSAGNHAQGVALAAAIMGVKAIVVMAQNATQSKVAATKGYGAEVVLHGNIWDEANDEAMRLVAKHGYTFVHPFDDLDLIAGQGTLGLEIAEQLPDVSVVVVPIGGGGLISGTSQAIKLKCPDARIIGVESSAAPAMHESLRAGHVITLEAANTAADGLRVRRVGDTTFRVVRDFVDEVVLVSEDEIKDSILWCLGRLKLLTEGAAASTVAALRKELIDAPAGAKVVCVLSGGNLDTDQFKALRVN
ncbi:MAG: threonine ammonia-lyase [Candidatus Dormibacteraceae bacterium]